MIGIGIFGCSLLSLGSLVGPATITQDRLGGYEVQAKQTADELLVIVSQSEEMSGSVSIFVLSSENDLNSAVKEGFLLTSGSLEEPLEFDFDLRELREMKLGSKLGLFVMDSFGALKGEHYFDMPQTPDQSINYPNPGTIGGSFFQSLPSDLVVASAIVPGPTNNNCGLVLPYWCGGAHSINITLRNMGPGFVPAGLTNATVFRQGPGSNRMISYQMNPALGPLPAGGTWFFQSVWYTGPNCNPPSGSIHTFTIRADGLGLVNETAEGNNVFAPVRICIFGLL